MMAAFALVFKRNNGWRALWAAEKHTLYVYYYPQSTHTHTMQHSAPRRRDVCVCAERARIKSSLDLCSYYTFKKATDVVFGASHSDRLPAAHGAQSLSGRSPARISL
jgi:hypothetical protein